MTEALVAASKPRLSLPRILEMNLGFLGLQRGIIEPALFAMLVLMAIVTTLMASPLFEQFYGRKARIRGDIPEQVRL